MKDWRKVVVAPETTVRDTIRIIDAGALQIALVVDSNNILLGTVTDGDIRRGILNGMLLEEEVRQVMNPTPTTAGPNETSEKLFLVMKRKQLAQIPLVDEIGHLVGLEVLEAIIQTPSYTNSVVIMAGGLGTRLRPLTDDYPKPLLKICGKPILETILENFIDYGFRRFYISLNYKADLISAYFGDGSKWGVEIHYVVENKRLGTAGALAHLPERPDEPFFVMNGDLLTKVNYQQLLAFHAEHLGQATMCVREFDFQVPYGVVQLEKHRLVGIEEKPTQRFFVNAGIYVLQPEVLDLIPADTFLDMPQLFKMMIELNHRTAVFPIREYWLDIGRKDDLERANLEFRDNFSC